MDINSQTFATHAADLRARICRVISELGCAVVALDDAETELAIHNHGEPIADLILLDQRLEAMATAFDSAGEHLTSCNDKVAQLISVTARALRTARPDPDDVPPNTDASIRQVFPKEGGAS